MNLCPTADGVLTGDRHNCHQSADHQVLLDGYWYAHHWQDDCVSHEANPVPQDDIDERLDKGFQSCLHVVPSGFRSRAGCFPTPS